MFQILLSFIEVNFKFIFELSFSFEGLTMSLVPIMQLNDENETFHLMKAILIK